MGHDITAQLDGERKSRAVDAFFEGKTDDYKKGTVLFRLVALINEN